VKKQTMQFLYGDRELVLTVKDLLTASVDVIVNPANNSLMHGGGLALQISQQAGESLDRESEQLIRQYGQIDTGMAVYTTAGNLPYKAVIHAVGPRMGEGYEQQKLEQTILNCLRLCEANCWNSIAFPAISTGVFQVPVELCAQAFFRTLTHYWDARHECDLERIMICLTATHFQSFFDAFREDAIHQQENHEIGSVMKVKDDSASESVGYVNLSESDIEDADSDEISDWFK